MEISCGIIIDSPGGWLICHATGTTRWDLPKGRVDDGETHLECAIRETLEETGLDLSGYTDQLVDLGQHSYIRNKDLHIYYLKYQETIDPMRLTCSSFVTDDSGKRKFPEVDHYDVVSPEEALRRFGRGLRQWIEENANGYY